MGGKAGGITQVPGSPSEPRDGAARCARVSALLVLSASRQQGCSCCHPRAREDLELGLLRRGNVETMRYVLRLSLEGPAGPRGRGQGEQGWPRCAGRKPRAPQRALAPLLLSCTSLPGARWPGSHTCAATQIAVSAAPSPAGLRSGRQPWGQAQCTQGATGTSPALGLALSE